MQDSCSCAHTNLLTNGLQCPSSVPYNATAEFCVSSDKRSLLPSRTNPEVTCPAKIPVEVTCPESSRGESSWQANSESQASSMGFPPASTTTFHILRVSPEKLDGRGISFCIIVVMWRCGWCGCVTVCRVSKNEEEKPQEVETRLTLKGHHKCVATVPLARIPRTSC
jgi:hypothetical protein